MSDSSDLIIVDTNLDQRNVSTKNTGELQITATFDGSSSRSNVNINVHVSRNYQQYGSSKHQNGKYERTDLDDAKNNGDRVTSNDSKVPAKNSSKVPTKEKECKYFMSQNGCKFNDECAFKHYRGEADAGSCLEDDDDTVDGDHIKDVIIAEEELDKELNQSKTNNNKTKLNKTIENESKKKLSKVCKYFLSKKGCSRSHCNFVHKTRSNSRNNDSNKGDLLQEYDTNDDDDDDDDDDDVKELVKKKEISNTKNLNTADKGIVKKNEISKDDELDTDCLKNDASTETFKEPLQNKEKEKVLNNKKKKKCRYFNLQNGCTNNNCPFLHVQKEPTPTNKNESGNPDAKLVEQQDSESQKKVQNDNKTSNKVCRFFKSEKGCNRGTKCRNIHDNENKQIDKDLEKLTLENDDEKKPISIKSASEKPDSQQKVQSQQQQRQPKTAQELRSTELTQLEKRWKDNFECVQKEPATIYIVSIQPTDPDWVRT